MLKTLAATIFFVALATTANAADDHRTEVKRADLTGTNMEIVVSIVEVPTGEGIERQTHHGEEVVYVLEGGTLALPDGKERSFPSGTTVVNARDVAHAGWKVKSDKPLKLLTILIVDKGKPLVEYVK